MRSRLALMAHGAALVALCATTFGGEARRKPQEDKRWQEAAKKAGLAARDIQRLAKNKVLMTNEAYKQVFSPYLGSRLPVFVTSDSLLNAFHVLYEESVLRLEQGNARKLPEILRFIWKNLATAGAQLTGKPQLVASAKRRAQAIIGTALKLVGDETLKADAKIARLIDAQVKKIQAAKAVEKPKWLGPPDSGFVALDYSRYKPRGFYTKSEGLKRYFRAVSWLQSIPFRVKDDEELLAILMLGNCVTYGRFEKSFAKMKDYRNFFRCFTQFIGVGDDWDLMTSAHQAQSLRGDLGRKLSRTRKSLIDAARREGGPTINDQIRFAPSEPSKTAEVGFRIISAYRTPDAILFQRTTDLRKFQRPFPTGLEVLAALGSSYARSRLTYKDTKRLVKAIDECEALFEGSSLYFDYLDCLAALLDEPEPDAPAFMSGEPWQIKSCQTALAGWAQLRHTWALQAKQTVHYLGITLTPPGFVEPEPEFFARMAALVERTQQLLNRAGALKPDPKAIAAELRAAIYVLKKKDVAKKGRKAFEALSRDEAMLLNKMMMFMACLEVSADRKDEAKFLAELTKKLEQLADRIEKSGLPDHPVLRKAVAEGHMDIEPLWRVLTAVCRRLEALAHKQLRGVALSRDEERFLRHYGEQIAGIMLYGGNAYLTPRDDAPRVVDVFANPNAAAYLEVGIGRARALYVLYPWQGREVLCRGAVLPYYEFTSPERLTDDQWQAMLDSARRPAIPKWVEPIVGGGGITTPKLRKGH